MPTIAQKLGIEHYVPKSYVILLLMSPQNRPVEFPKTITA
jgi:hypothetical protein